MSATKKNIPDRNAGAPSTWYAPGNRVNLLENGDSEQKNEEQQMVKKSGESPIDAASRLASLAEQQEMLKDFKGAEESNKKASEFYLEAIAFLKQKPDQDPEALKTLELLSETHRRKAKMLAQRVQCEGLSAIEQVKKKMQALKKEKQQAQRKAAGLPTLDKANTAVEGGDKPLSEADRQRVEREKYLEQMKEELILVQAKLLSQAREKIEKQIEYQRFKIELFSQRFTEVLQTLKAQFNEQTKELIVSHGEKFITVQNTNPFAKEALQESICLSKIDKNNKKLEELIIALKKFNQLSQERLNDVTKDMETLVNNEKCVPMNFGQVTALAFTPIGQAIGLGQMVNYGINGNRLLLEEMQRQLMNQDLLQSMISGNLNQSQDMLGRSSAGGPMSSNQRGMSEAGSIPQHIYIMEIQKRDKHANEFESKLEELNTKYKQALIQLKKSNNKAEAVAASPLAGASLSGASSSSSIPEKDLELTVHQLMKEKDTLTQRLEKQEEEMKEYKRKYHKYYEYCKKYIPQFREKEAAAIAKAKEAEAGSESK